MALPYVVLSGTVAAGKSTIVGLLARELRVPAKHERPEENPWFERASTDPERWGLACQLAFAVRAVSDAESLVEGGIQERFLNEHIAVMAAWHQRLGHLRRDELNLLRASLQLLDAGSHNPDLVVWLRAPSRVLMQRIAERSRPEEVSIKIEELDLLDELYAEFFHGWSAAPVLEIDTAQKNYRDRAVVKTLTRAIREALQ
jgi:deoxyadenosine/deoxycytidine kinase